MKLHRLNEGITHIEDLSIDQFLEIVKNISEFYCSEKIDGANLWFGLDETGRFFTTREQKGRDKDPKYSAADYNMVSAYNGFRSAHDALQAKSTVIKKHLQPNDMVEVEIVFGKQPNVVKYSSDGTNYVVLLRPVEGTPRDRFSALADALENDEVSVQSKVVDTIDGENLTKTKLPFKWSFVKNISSKVSSELVSTKKLKNSIQKLETFLNQKNESVSSAVGKETSNFGVLTMRLTGVPVKSRESVKLEKEALSEKVLTDFKLPIKRSLMSDLAKNGSFLSNKLGKDPEDQDMEGFVLSGGGKQIKLVDRDLFTSVNEFNFKIRNELNGIVMSDDLESSLENRGGIFGTVKIRIANLFDVRDLAKSAKARKIFAANKGHTPLQTVQNFAKSLKIRDFEQYRIKIVAILSSAEKELKERLDQFKLESADYKIKLKNGKEVEFSEESRKRTLLAFAELNKEIKELKQKIREAKSLEDVIIAIYGRFVDELFKGQMNESLTEGKLELPLLKSVSTICEDGEGGEAPVAPAETSPAAGATTAGMIASYPQRMFNGKVLKRIKRNYFPKKKSHK